MPSVTYIEPDGTTRTLQAERGVSVMQLAVMNDVRGIEGECGGCCSCATCHVYVEPECAARLPAPADDERQMLEATAARREPNSRLGCQLRAGEAFDALVVRIPDRQY